MKKKNFWNKLFLIGMLDTVHVFAGLAIGKHIASPLWAFVFGMVSHVILDAIPHWDGDKGKKYENQEKDGECKRVLGRQGKQIIFWDITAASCIGAMLFGAGILWPGFPDFSSLISYLYTHPSLVSGVFGALFWDIVYLAYLFYPSERLKRFTFFSLHKKIQNYKTPEKIPSLLFQGGLVVLFVILFILW